MFWHGNYPVLDERFDDIAGTEALVLHTIITSGSIPVMGGESVERLYEYLGWRQ